MLSEDVCAKCLESYGMPMFSRNVLAWRCPAFYHPLGYGQYIACDADPPKDCEHRFEHAIYNAGSASMDSETTQC